jgi:hypothetical protein
VRREKIASCGADFQQQTSIPIALIIRLKKLSSAFPLIVTLVTDLDLTLDLPGYNTNTHSHISKMKFQNPDQQSDDSLLVDISDALSERDRVRFTVHTRTKLPQFSKQVLSVVRQHEEFIWLHDCLVENDQYAGYIIPPPPPKPDFDSSREKLQRLGDCEASLTKEEFIKMKQELEAEYLAIFKKTVAMHETFLQRLASHEKFREDNNFKVFLEYENELSVKSKSKREKIAGSISNIGKSLSDFVITTSQVANSNNIAVDEQYFDKERLFLALYYNSIRETAICADKVAQAHKCVANSYLNIAQQLVKLASIEVVPITANSAAEMSSSCSVSGPLPSLTMPSPPKVVSSSDESNNEVSSSEPIEDDEEIGWPTTSTSSATRGNKSSSAGLNNDKKQSDITNSSYNSTGGCANDHTSEGLKKLLLNVSDYLENAKKIEARLASDEDLKLTDTFLYYKRDTVAAQELLTRRLRFMSEYENAVRNLDKARLKGMTAMQYADVIQKQAKENFVSISKLAKQELIDYKKRRVSSFKKAFTDLAELEIKHLRAHSQLIVNCLNKCRGLAPEEPPSQQQQEAEKSNK